MQKLVTNAIYKQTDFLLLQIEYQNFELEYKTYLAEYESNLYDLNLLCGISDSGTIDLQEINLTLRADTVTSSQFLVSYMLDSMNIATEQIINELKYKPQFDFFANTGLNAVYLPSLNRFGFSTGISFSWNIYDGKQRKIHRQITDINLQSLEFERQFFITQNTNNKNKILTRINSLDQRMIFIDEQINRYNLLSDTYSDELSQGEVSVMDFKNLLKDIASKKQEYLLLKMEKLALINVYNYWNY
ncbi:MAG: TolC family protein [Bacteroidota bacterium]